LAADAGLAGVGSHALALNAKTREVIMADAKRRSDFAG
jgi:hypothetical protein